MFTTQNFSRGLYLCHPLALSAARFHFFPDPALFVYIQPILLYGSESWALTQALEDRIAAFDNFCLQCILRISYTAHVINADVRLRAGSPPQLLPLIQTRRLRFFGHVARMSDSQDTFRALHTSTRGLRKDWRRRQDVHVTPGFRP